jgi:hypothetical protein
VRDGAWALRERRSAISAAERPAELVVLAAHRVRAFCLTNANLRGTEQAQRLVTNLPRIMRAAARSGPYIYGVYADSITPLWPR